MPTPESHFGFRMGTDGRLASAADIETYFELVAGRSDRVKIVDLGPTTEGHRTIAAIVSAPENIRNLDRIREENQRLADPRTLPADEARRLSSTHKVVVAIGCSIHATEIGATQAAGELLYELATSHDAATLDQLRQVVLILVPMLNPDGHRLVVDWYNRYKGTPFDGGPMPWPDHRYAGHDINRDGFMMNLAENRNLSRFFYTQWHPQVFLAMHEMENDGPRFFAPPNADPIDANYDPIIWREAALLGSAMTLELERDQHAGVMSNSRFDYYWPGYEDSAPLGHNTVCLLTEAARVNVASPVTEPPRDVRGQISAPHPWPGGRWTLRDIVDYELSAAHGLLRAAAAYRGELVRNFYEMGRRAVDRGQRGSPFAFIIPPEQHDAIATIKLETLLVDGGIEIQHALEPFRAGAASFPAGTDIILLSQPYRAYVKTLLERQDYPVAAAPNQRPYDVAGWTLPAQMGVDVRTIDRPFELPALSRVTAPTIAASFPGEIWGDRKPGHYIVELRGNAGALALNRLLAAGAEGDVDGQCRRNQRLHVSGRFGRRAGRQDRATGDRRCDQAARSARRRRKGTNASIESDGTSGLSRPCGAVQTVGRRERRGLDALAPRAVRVSVYQPRQQGNPRGQSSRALRRDHSSERARRVAGRRPAVRRDASRICRRTRRRRRPRARRVRQGRRDAHLSRPGRRSRD